MEEVNKKVATVKLSMTPVEKELLQGIAKRSGVTISELVRLTLIYQSVELPKPYEGPRYKLRTDEPRSEHVRVQVTASERQALHDRAEALGTTVSDLMRRSALNGEIQSVEFDSEAVRKNYHELAKQGTNLNQLMYFLNANGMPAYDREAVLECVRRVHDAARKSADLFDRLQDEIDVKLH